MYKFNGFTDIAVKALNLSINSAQNFGHTYIGSEHLLLGLIKVNSGIAYNSLTECGVLEHKYTLNLISKVGKGNKTKLTVDDLTPRARKILEGAIVKSTVSGNKNAGTDHILTSILNYTDSLAVVILNEIGVNISLLLNKLKNSNFPEHNDNSNSASSSSNKLLQRYSTNLNEKAISGKIDPLIGRDKEIQRIIQILCRRKKNNPCLLGDPGVGKTAIIEGLAMKIENGDVPDFLRNKQIISLNLSGLIAGTKYRGDFEDRLNNIMNEVKANSNIMLFIDEIHNIVGAGAAEGSADIANMLKPTLTSGDIQIIGATTIAEYRKYISKDPALERRFQPITIEEPTENQSIEILQGIKSKYEQYHKVAISDEAIVAAVKLSSRFLTDRFLPDKAIDLIDEAACRVKLSEDNDFDKELKFLNQQKIQSFNSGNIENVSELRKKETILNKQHQTLKVNKTTKAQDVAKVLSEWTLVPLSDLTVEENIKLQNIENDLKQSIIAQDKAISALSKALRRSRTGIKDPKKPIGSFIFLGPTGVGKTYLCKILAKTMFGKEDAIIRFDMSEFMEKHSVSRLIGSPPGYIGFDDGGQLTEQVKKKPFCVLVFDEVEKAHPDVLNILLQILDDGHLTDSQGRKIDFKNTIIIMTSNIGSKIICNQENSIGFKELEKSENDVKKRVLSEVKKLFRPEFLNRIDEIIMFNRLSEKDNYKISKLMLDNLANRVKELGISLAFSDRVVKYIAKKGFDPLLGARPLKRVIQSEIEDTLSDEILSSSLKKGDEAYIDLPRNSSKIQIKVLVNACR